MNSLPKCNPESQGRWGACALVGSVPRWCPRRLDNAEKIIANLAKTTERHPDPWFVDLARICGDCRLDVQQRIGLDGLLASFMQHVGEDIVGELDIGDESPDFQPENKTRRTRRPRRAPGVAVLRRA
jgi:hypothetical protein